MDATLQQLMQEIIDRVRERETLITALKKVTEERDELKKELQSVRNPDKKEGK